MLQIRFLVLVDQLDVGKGYDFVGKGGRFVVFQILQILKASYVQIGSMRLTFYKIARRDRRVRREKANSPLRSLRTLRELLKINARREYINIVHCYLSAQNC